MLSDYKLKQAGAGITPPRETRPIAFNGSMTHVRLMTFEIGRLSVVDPNPETAS